MEVEQQQEKKTILKRIKNFFIESRRVFRITKKPTMEEFKIIVKVSGLGILLIGLIGFIINMVWQVIS